jgi:hypothetical protein
MSRHNRRDASGRFIPSRKTQIKRALRAMLPGVVAALTPTLAIVPFALAGLLS